MVLIVFKSRVAHPAHARIGCEPFGHLLRVGAMAFHAYAQRFQVHAHDQELIGAGVEPKSRMSCAVALVMYAALPNSFA